MTVGSFLAASCSRSHYFDLFLYFRLAGNEGMEKEMETTIMGTYIYIKFRDLGFRV